MTYYLVSGNKDCTHQISFLGADGGGNEYYMCQECGGLVINATGMGKIKEGKALEEIEEPTK